MACITSCDGLPGLLDAPTRPMVFVDCRMVRISSALFWCAFCLCEDIIPAMLLRCPPTRIHVCSTCNSCLAIPFLRRRPATATLWLACRCHQPSVFDVREKPALPTSFRHSSCLASEFCMPSRRVTHLAQVLAYFCLLKAWRRHISFGCTKVHSWPQTDFTDILRLPFAW